MAAPISGTQAPGYYRIKVGDYEVTVLSDGSLTLDHTLFAGDEAGAENVGQICRHGRKAAAVHRQHHAERGNEQRLLSGMRE